MSANAGATRPPLLPASERRESGVDYLNRIIAGEIGGVPIGDTLGFRLVEAQADRVALVGNPDEGSFNLIGTVHGGWAAAILDSAMALSVLASLDQHHGFTTLDIKINYLRPITRETGPVRAEGWIVHGGKRIALCEATLKDPRGKLLCHGTGSCLIFPHTHT